MLNKRKMPRKCIIEKNLVNSLIKAVTFWVLTVNSFVSGSDGGLIIYDYNSSYMCTSLRSSVGDFNSFHVDPDLHPFI